MDNHLYQQGFSDQMRYQSLSTSKNIKKSAVESELDKQIDDYANTIEIEEDFDHHELLQPKLKREKIKLEMKETAKVSELSQHLNRAFKILFVESERDFPASQKLKANFLAGSEQFDKLSMENTALFNLQTLLQISDESMQAILEILTNNFAEGNYSNALSLSHLLVILHPGYSEYWFRMGLAAQKCENYELASKAYEAASKLDANMIGPRILRTECLIQLNCFNEAQAELEAVKNLAANNKDNIEQMWLDLIPVIESNLKT